MTNWTIHWLEAAGSLDEWKEAMGTAIEAARVAVAETLDPPPLDILVQRSKRVIPETGDVGYAHGPHTVSLLFDPENENFEERLSSGGLSRTMVHEVHHCLRNAGPGYGETLGEVIVSEGQACRFVQHVCANPPEPWECAVDAETLERYFPSVGELSSTSFDQSVWFFGKDDRLPMQYGYTLGYELVGHWIEDAAPISADTWINVAAQNVLDAGTAGLQARWAASAKLSD